MIRRRTKEELYAGLKERPLEEQAKVKEKMYEFEQGFGELTQQGALVTCAQIASRKEYKFNPTVLKDEKEFAAYLNTLKQAKKPLRERFLIAQSGTSGVTNHWMCGDIQIDKDGKAKILIIDSLGIKKDFNVNMTIFITRKAVEAFQNTFPNHEIYISDNRRQFGPNQCQIFTLDDLKHLFTMQNFLDEKYKATGVFGFLEDQLKNSEINRKIELDLKTDTADVIKVEMPLRFERTQQDKAKLMDEINRRQEEAKQPVNKKGQTALESLNAKDSLRGGAEETNKRIDDQLDGILTRNLEYLVTTDNAKVEKDMQAFTLAGFQKRVAAEQEVKASNSNSTLFGAQKPAETSSQSAASRQAVTRTEAEKTSAQQGQSQAERSGPRRTP